MHGMRVAIEKRIPMQAGLGGGSSDAAAALRMLAAVWAPGLPIVELETLGAGLGADVPFFFRGGTVLGLVKALGTVLSLAVPEAFENGGTQVIPGRGRVGEETDVAEFRDMVVIIKDRIVDAMTKKMTHAIDVVLRATISGDLRR